MVARLPDSGNVGLGRSFKKAPRATNATHFVQWLGDSNMEDRLLGLGQFGFTATNNRVQTTAIKRECEQTEQNKKNYESSKQFNHLFHLGEQNFQAQQTQTMVCYVHFA